MSWKISSSFAVAASLLALSGYARAQECAADTDCVKGFTCQVTGGSGCASGGTATPAPCPEGQDCFAAPEPTPPDCEVKEYKSCVPADCKADSDCATGMVCHSEDISVCSGGAAATPCTGDGCSKDQALPLPMDTCTTETKSACVPKYALPCEEAADCGEGFDCVADQTTECSGGSAVGSGGSSDPGAGAKEPGSNGFAAPLPPQDAGADEPPPVDADAGAPNCTTTTLDTKSCVAKEIQCSDATQCPTDWTCQLAQNVSGGDCTEAAPAPGEAVDAGTSTGCDAQQKIAPSTTGYCQPPYANLGYYGHGRDEQADGSATGGGVETADSDDGLEPPTANGGDTGNGSGADAKKDDSKCSVSHVGADGSSHGGLAFVALGLVAALRARRRNRA